MGMRLWSENSMGILAAVYEEPIFYFLVGVDGDGGKSRRILVLVYVSGMAGMRLWTDKSMRILAVLFVGGGERKEKERSQSEPSRGSWFKYNMVISGRGFFREGFFLVNRLERQVSSRAF